MYKVLYHNFLTGFLKQELSFYRYTFGATSWLSRHFIVLGGNSNAANLRVEQNTFVIK